MLTDDYLWKKSFKVFAESIKASFTVCKSPSLGYGADFITCSISNNFKDGIVIISQTGISGNNEIGLSFLVFEYKHENPENFSLSLNQREFFDKLFPMKRVKTGSERFDRAFVIKTSDSVLAMKAFGNKRVQELFLGNRFLLFNAQTQNSFTTMKFKSMKQKLYPQTELQALFDDFLFLIEKLH